MQDEEKVTTAAFTLLHRAQEIFQARTAYPGMEIGAAYQKWKEARGEKVEFLMTIGKKVISKQLIEKAKLRRERPCTRDNCSGTQVLEGVCSGCVEGQAGYKTKWTCRLCLHRDLSKEGLNEWMKSLSSF